MASFNLIDERWIPVVKDGERLDVSLRTALLEAHAIEQLATEDALQAVALLRQVILPVILDALGAPATASEWRADWEKAQFDGERLEHYFAEWHDRFDLLSDSRPFAQTANLRAQNGETKPISLIVPALAPKVPLFSARNPSDPLTLSPAEAARAVLAAQCWDTGGTKTRAEEGRKNEKGQTTGNPPGPLSALGVVVPEGRTLAETIRLNTPIDRLRPEDRPQWRGELSTPKWEERPARGLLDLLTWQSRRIRLVCEDDCRGNGARIGHVVLTAGDRLSVLPEYEPHTAWGRPAKPKKGDPPRIPLRHKHSRECWRGLTALLATEREAQSADKSTLVLLRQLADKSLLPEGYPLQVMIAGMKFSGGGSGAIADVVKDRLPLPLAALPEEAPARGVLLEVVDNAEQLQDATNQLEYNLRRCSGGGEIKKGTGQRLGDSLIHRFTPLVRRILVELQREPHRLDDVVDRWRKMACRLCFAHVEPALSSMPPTAFRGRVIQECDRQTKKVIQPSIAEALYKARVRKVLGIEQSSVTDVVGASSGGSRG